MLNFYKQTPKNWLKISLGLRGTIASLSASAYATDNAKLGFWLLAIGGVSDFLIHLYFGEQTIKNNDSQ